MALNYHKNSLGKSIRKRRQRQNKSMKRISHSPAAGWHAVAPGRHERTVMKQRCGSKCFLGPGISFPICRKNTCTIDQRGVHAAYNRAQEWKHRSVSQKARRLMKKVRKVKK